MARNFGRKRVLVTGGAGFLGSHLIDRLLERGDRAAQGDRASLAQASSDTAHGARVNEMWLR